MKISKVGSAKQTASAKKKKSTAKAGEFADQVRGAAAAGEAEGVHGVEGPSSVGAVDSILAVQEVPTSTDGRSKGLMLQHGEDILGRLDELRLAILSGVLSKDKLAQLAQALRQKRKLSDDPKLNEIIEEIELRAEVEVAKLTRDL